MCAGIRLVIAENIERIYRENCQNLGVLTTTDFSIIDRVRRGEEIPLSTFTAGGGGRARRRIAKRRPITSTPPPPPGESGGPPPPTPPPRGAAGGAKAAARPGVGPPSRRGG